MLKEIYIENLAIIEKATIALDRGFVVFTGETGAGKSILINGINAVLGVRVSRDIVRTGCNKAIISALFTNISQNVADKLTELGIVTEDNQLTLTREVNADGGSIARINGRAVNVSLLREIGELSVNIHGQHDNQILLNPDRHIDILDGFSSDNSLLLGFKEAFTNLQETAKNLSKLKKLIAVDENKKAEIIATVKEISALKLQENEDVLVEEEYLTAKNAEDIILAMRFVENLLESDDGVLPKLHYSNLELEKVLDVYPLLESILERINSAKIEIKDISDEIRSLMKNIDIEPQRLEYLKNRRSDIFKITKKYGTDVNGLIALCIEKEKEFDNIGINNLELEKLSKEYKAAFEIAVNAAKKLSEHRKRNAALFTESVTKELIFLNMPDVLIDVRHTTGKMTLTGIDNIEFLISANKGEEPKPISKIASGGELSRIMLALKSVLAAQDGIQTLIFDEIDTGVSGKAAAKIGIKLRELAETCQVLCVTHLAQIAAKGTSHFLIEKHSDTSHTKTTVTQLDFNQRVAEIARIIGGEDPGELMLQNATEMLRGGEMLRGSAPETPQGEQAPPDPQ